MNFFKNNSFNASLVSNVFFFAIFFLIQGVIQCVWADEALLKTEQVLTEASKRQEFLNQDANAKAADQSLKSLLGSEQRVEEAYQVSSEIFKRLAIEGKGDAEYLKRVLAEAQANPAAFLKSLSSEEQERIRKISQEVEFEKNHSKSLP